MSRVHHLLEEANYSNDSRVRAARRKRYWLFKNGSVFLTEQLVQVCAEMDTESVEAVIDDYSKAALAWLQEKGIEAQITRDGDITLDRVICNYELCSGCKGRGTMINPSIDCNGLTKEDFDDDPDFADGYFGGDYEMTCSTCNGLRVIVVPDFPAALQSVIDEMEDADAELASMYEAERRMGC